jgi:hypothetical protein
MFYSFIQGIKNLINWFYIIYFDRDWDYCFLYKILHHKLKSMENFHYSNNTFAVNSERTAKQIKIARILCERLIDGDYLENAMIPYDNKYDSGVILGSKPVEGKPGWSQLVFSEDKKQNELYRHCSKHSDYMENQDKNYLFEWMKKHIDGWWE